jgi:hypothetical protein
MAPAVPSDCVKNEDVIKLVAPNMPGHRSGAKGELKAALSSLIGEKEVDYIQHFVEGCVLTGSPLLTPCVRNSFFIHR